jgi:hypothetical protein
VFDDRRIPEMLFRYRARNWPEGLSADEGQAWEEYRRHRLTAADGGGSIQLSGYRKELARLMVEPSVTPAQREILSQLADWPNTLGLYMTSNENAELHAAKAATIDSFVDFAQGGAFPQWPLEVFLEVSNLCDLKCAMCNTFSALHTSRRGVVRSQERGFLALEQVMEPLAPLFRHALQVHAFGFGEPSIHPGSGSC